MEQSKPKPNVPIPSLDGTRSWIVVCVQSVRYARAANGKAYCSAVASNSTGKIAIRIWGEALDACGEIATGLWGLVGKKTDYKGQEQFEVDEFRPLDLKVYLEHQSGKPPNWAKAWVFDIETIPLDTFRDRSKYLIDRDRQAGKLSESDVAALEQSPEALQELRFRSGALAGATGRIVSIALMIAPIAELGRPAAERVEHVFGITENGKEEPEATALARFFGLLENFDPELDEFVGHNLINFDLPFVLQRGVAHGLRVPRVIDLSGYSPKGIYDTMRAWWGGDRRTIKLDDLAWALGLESSKTDEVDGSKIYDLYLAGKLAEIRDYNLADVRLTHQVYERLIASLGR